MTPAIFGIAGAELSANERAFFREADPAGYILFARNCVDREQLRRLTDQLRAIHGRERLFVSVDQEGGRVARLKPPHWAAYPSGEAFDRLYQIAPVSAIEAARAAAHAMALELSFMGITVDFYPVLDVRQAGMHDVIGDRALGGDPMQVAALGRAILDGLARGGVAGCIKHMPGHGGATADSHQEMPTVTAGSRELERDIAPFRALNRAPVGMTGHVLFTAWDEERPATHSAIIIREVIRRKIGFSGLLLTDDIDMEALDGSVPERSARALAAGCDAVVNCWARMTDMVALAEVLPTMDNAAMERLDTALAATQIRNDPGDHGELLASCHALLDLAGEAA